MLITNQLPLAIEANLLDLQQRQLEPEIMDNPDLGLAEHQQALNGLARIHAVTNSAAQIWKPIRAQILASGNKSASILDVGCGDAYMLRKFHVYAQRDGIELELHGCDFSAKALQMADEVAQKADTQINLVQFDITQPSPIPVQADYAICSLFLHHFEDQQVVEILKKLDAAATQCVLVHDLRRTVLGYALCWVGVHTLSTSSVVRTDGLLSVRAAFSVVEMRTLLQRAGFADAEITTGWPQRFTISWRKHPKKA